MSIVGAWELEVKSPIGTQEFTLTIKDDGSATMKGAQGEVTLTDVKVDGENFTGSMKVPLMGREIDATMEIKANGYSVSGQVKTAMGAATVSGSIIERKRRGGEAEESLYREIRLEQGTLEWKRWRLGGFGASDAPVLMKQNPWKSIDALLDEKAGKGGDYESEAMRQGKMLEAAARDAYCSKKGIQVKSACLQHRKYSWARASLDGISNDGKTIVEIKCGERAYDLALSGEIPRYYHGQLQHIMFITGLNMIDYWCWRPGNQGVLFKMRRHEKYIKVLIEQGEKYKIHLGKETP